MRIDEDKIWNIYMDSLIEEKRKSKKTDKDIDDMSVQNDKEGKKGKENKKQKKGLPPWLKRNSKGKNVVKEAWDTKGPTPNEEQEFSNTGYRGYDKMSEDEYSTVVGDINRVLDEIAEKSVNHRAVCEYLQSYWADNEQSFYDELVSTDKY